MGWVDSPFKHQLGEDRPGDWALEAAADRAGPLVSQLQAHRTLLVLWASPELMPEEF